MLDLNKIREDLGKYVSKMDESIDYSVRIMVEKLAIEQFGRLPYMNTLTDSIYNEENGDEEKLESFSNIPVYDDDCSDEELREKNENINMTATLQKIIDIYPDAIIYKVRAGKLHDSIIIHDTFIYYSGVFYMDKPELPEDIKNCVVEKEDVPRIRWILRNGQGRIITKFMDITPKGDIETNYNDDFPSINTKVTNLIHADESSIIILHGKPGTGKTSYIRDLIGENGDVNFYWIDSSMFAYIDSSEFIEYISSCKNAVFILEDSESLLTSREEQKNPAMQSLLSISDGMLGDSLKLKFICTFNTELKNIDSAILRKGRCKVKYEFKALKADKVRKIFKELNLDESLVKGDMPLCEVYNFLEDNGVKCENKRIGF